MLTEQGIVSGVDSDGIWVETLKRSSCGQCSARAGCGQRLIAGAFDRSLASAGADTATLTGTSKDGPRPQLVDSSIHVGEEGFISPHRSSTTVKAFFPAVDRYPEQKNAICWKSSDWKVGDVALIALDERVLVQAALISYGAPLLGLVTFSLLGGLLNLSDMLVAFLALIGLVAGGFIVRQYAEINLGESKYHPMVVNKLIAPTLSMSDA